MTSKQHQNWINKGRPFRLMRPLAALRDRLRSMGYTVYDIGNLSHLNAQPPEDHTPFSETGWPGAARFGIGYAIDVMPPPAGSGLPSLQALGAALRRDRQAGLIPWLKYMNWGPNNNTTAVKDSWTSGALKRTASSDTGHIHGSGATGYEDDTRWDSYDPFGDDDVSLNEPTGWSAQFLPNPDGAESGPWLGGTYANQLQHIRETTFGSYIMDRLNTARIDALTSIIETLAGTIQAGGGNVETAAILEAVDARLEELARKLAEEQRDAVADLGEGGAAQVRGPQS